MRHAVGIVLLAAATSVFAQSPPRLHGFLSARAISVDAERSWAAGGTGPFDVGAKDEDGRRFVDVEVAQVGFEWAPRSWLTMHADGVARREPGETKGKGGGLVQAYVDLHNERWRFRAGAFWLSTSRENTDPLWTSPYTITFSALNTWIGEEMRPIGADLQYSPNFYMSGGVTVFRGIDTMGTVLSDRGFALGNRLSVYGERLPLSEPGETTRPIGPDLDDQNGYSARIRMQIPERAMLQITHIDNRAKLVRELKGEEPWKTNFNLVGVQTGMTSPTTIAAEWARGSTTVGFPRGTFKLNFDTAYILFSSKRGVDRWTTRVERFKTGDDESRAVTVAWLRDIGKQVRFGAEYVRVSGDRKGSMITAELRYAF